MSTTLIKDDKLVASTTGGTSMACVLEHVAETRPASAVVVTDGYIERLHPSLVKKAAGVRLYVPRFRECANAASPAGGQSSVFRC